MISKPNIQRVQISLSPFTHPNFKTSKDNTLTEQTHKSDYYTIRPV